MADEVIPEIKWIIHYLMDKADEYLKSERLHESVAVSRIAYELINKFYLDREIT